MSSAPILLVGEICVDFTIGKEGQSPKVRHGGIVHAARGLWAAGISYAVAAVCPKYLLEGAEKFLSHHGCVEFIQIGEVVGAPNLVIIGDVREVGHQGYEDILRNERSVLFDRESFRLKHFKQAVVFPGRYELAELRRLLPHDAEIVIDAAYDAQNAAQLSHFKGAIKSFVISTSSELFVEVGGQDIEPLLKTARELGSATVLLKENRGGSRFFNLATGEIEEVPAVLSETANSVGVGDAFTAVFASYLFADNPEAVWRGMQVATNYALTTFPDDFRSGVQRDFSIPIDVVKGLGGVSLPWHDRKSFPIYLAAPDFSYISKPEIDAAVASLEYHNFCVRRPVQENGEAKTGSPKSTLLELYFKDVALIDECDLMFAVPLTRDPGTLVEIGLAIAKGKPVIVYDPRHENNNTMVICGADEYSGDLDLCLNRVFELLGKVRSSK
ncbi:nucleoside 2-deoxyribosyltransferase [Mesorhizobium sp. RP14(2022)]|uniref:Nucleoside 2-deoxyribosyltransferase n=1 Tax=Mesorhizobium liriopis TaxID=2953882 RepID=A0ABT1CAJ9_9HYPH|nr:nucleoside 2-deoxyribosyltransferase [Mesorhizobium liriopis]MCO6051518.1 nucleoside 2-deoxyribosyltransferase [Mesorhizobium liriopis]